jgi:predicted amidohydrolase
LKAKISIIQFQPALCDPAKSIDRLSSLLDKASGSDLIVLPELSNSGYNFRDMDQAYSCSETIDGKGFFQQFLVTSSGKLGAFIVSGINEREGKNLYNSAILVNASGIIGKYRKMHLFMNEKDVFQKGNAGLPVFNLGKIKIGIQICFDYLFPEPWRIMAQKGADIICHPSNLLTENPHKCLPGIALMNRIYIATANRTGIESNLLFNGKSFFTDPSGRVPEIASPDQPAVISMDIDTDISANKMITPRNHVFDDRRPDLYV